MQSFHPQASRGLSLVEVLVALLLISLALTATLALWIGHHKVQARSSQQLAAQAYLMDTMERLRASAPLEEGRDEIPLDAHTGRALPQGIPRAGGVLVIDTSPWEGAGPGERLQHVRLSLRWRLNDETVTSRLEGLMVGEPEPGEGP